MNKKQNEDGCELLMAWTQRSVITVISKRLINKKANQKDYEIEKPEHVLPLPVYPLLHRQVYEPGVLTQVAKPL